MLHKDFKFIEEFRNYLSRLSTKFRLEINLLLINPVKIAQLNHGMIYPFRISETKMTQLTEKSLYPLKAYLDHAFYNCPDELFVDGPRASKLRFSIGLTMEERPNEEICKLTALALANKKFESAHDIVEDTFLEKDPNTIAAEIPVWTNYFELNGSGNGFRITELIGDTKPLTGHIDLLQVKDDRINVLDFKPNASKEKWAPTQLFVYALMLSKRTGLSLQNFRCCYFDEKTSFWFDPSMVKI